MRERAEIGVGELASFGFWWEEGSFVVRKLWLMVGGDVEATTALLGCGCPLRGRQLRRRGDKIFPPV